MRDLYVRDYIKQRETQVGRTRTNLKCKADKKR